MEFMKFHANDPERDVFIANLPYRITDRDLFDLASAHGKVCQVRVALDHATGLSRGFSFLRMATPEDAQRVIAGLNGQIVSGRVLRAESVVRRPPARPPKEDNPSGQTR